MSAELRSISQILFTGEVSHNLINVGFDVIPVARKHEKSEGTRIDMPFILVQLVNSAQSRNIFNLKNWGICRSE